MRRILAVGVVVVILAVGVVGLDLRGRGPIWQALYRMTGEERPINQLVGFVHYLGNLTRQQPSTADDVPVNITVDNPIGVNTFLEQEPEFAKRERSMQMIVEAGIGWIRQEFTWQDIEIHGRGDFIDRRNDAQGVDAWLKYDSIVNLAQKYKVHIIARLGSPPAWSQPKDLAGTFAPPEDVGDFVNYAVAVASRYKGKVTHYQVWNEPNLGFEWGKQNVNPEAYTMLLCRTYTALKAVDPGIIVISGAIAPTIDMSAYNLNGLIYLQRMYNAGAGKCFDVLGAQGYGLFTGPTDQRMRITTINYGYPLWLRDMMVANGDAKKPIWIGEMAWNPVPTEAQAPDVQDRLMFGQVTDEQAAQYAIDAYERARKDWPWVGVVCYWYFRRPDTHEMNQSFYYFRMVNPDFSPQPVYNAIKDYATRLYPKVSR